jgi:outer membrane protein assembly factor BamB
MFLLQRATRITAHRGHKARRSSAVIGTLGLIGALLAACGGSSGSGTPARTSSTESTAAVIPSYAPWPMALHDARHSATAAVIGPQTGNLLWSHNLGGNLTPGPVVGADGTIYVASTNGVLYALNPMTGAELWEVQGTGPSANGDDLSVSPLILPSGELLWPGPGGVVDEVSPKGTVVWSHGFGGTVLSPVLNNSTVYLVTTSGNVSAVAVGGAEPVVAWSIQVGNSSFGSPVIDGTGQLVTTTGRDIVAVRNDGTKGVIAWRNALNAAVEVSASSDAKGHVYVTDNSGTAYCFTDAGQLLWSRRVGAESYSSSSVTRAGSLVVGDNSGRLNVVDAATGFSLGRFRASKLALWAAQAIDERGDLYVGTQSKTVVGFSPSGRTLFRDRVSGPIDGYPALTGAGVLIIGDESGTVYAFGPGR